MPINRITATDSGTLTEPEQRFEYSLRPSTFAEVIGREKEKKTLAMMIKAASMRGEPLDHVLFHGPPGLGKTSLAHVTANELKVSMQITSGPAIEKQGDLAAILTAMPKGGILFIDEIHRLNRTIEEILYPAMEDRVLDLVVGKGAGAKTLRIDLEPFTIIGATTRIGLLSKPLLDRFGVDFRLDYYSLPEMSELVKQKAKILQMAIEPEAAALIAARSRRTPRVAVKILKRVHDNATANEQASITAAIVEDTLSLLEIDALGLDNLDRQIITTIIKSFAGGPVGIEAIAASVSEEAETISDVYEPFLIQEGFLERTARGRRATAKAYKHLGLYGD